ncbi:MAG: hypothetical protein HWN66_17475, partial [Candidatus Helarchaeota archaeon]|nr:hypothetical protein [Candidatus Helarchaeota archaeon]
PIFYQVVLNTSWTSIREYMLEINLSKQYFNNKTLRITVEINAIETELVSPEYPRVVTEWGTNVTITANFRTVGLVGINGSGVTDNWTISTITELGGGLYQIELNTSESLGEYILEINAAKQYFVNKTLLITIEINAIETELVSNDYPRIISEWNFNATITVNYRTASGSLGIPNALVSINWSLSVYSIRDLGNGLYQIELNTSISPREYVLEINVSRQYFVNKTMLITVQINSVDTELVSDDYPRIISEWNFNATITVNYRTASGSLGIPSALVSINWSLSAYTILDLGNGLYQIELNTSLSPREFVLEINVSRQFYTNKTMLITVQINSVETELISQNYPRVVGEWGKNITIEINFRTAEGHYGINTSIITSNWTLTYYTISEIGNGLYQLELNTSWCAIQEYTLEINASRLYHSNQTIKITVQINSVETVLVYESVASIPYGQNATINLKYTDLAGNPIPSASNGSDLITVNFTHWVSYNDSLEYPFSIVVESLGLNQSDLLNITASKPNYKSQSVLVFLTYRPKFTSLTNLNETIISLPVDESTYILVFFNDTDFNQGIAGANLTFYGYNNLSSTDLGLGYYRIDINATNVVDAYSILVTIQKFAYLDNNIQFVIQIKEWVDFTTATFSSMVQTAPIDSSATFSVLLEDDFTETYFENINVFYSWDFGTGNLTDNANGNYSLVLNTAGKPPGTYSIIINATTQDGHLLVTQTVTLVITGGAEVSWWVQYSWIFGILAAILAMAAGYRIRNKWRERDWEKKVKHLYILTKSGVPLFDKRLGGITTADPSLVTSALIGISSIVQEIVDSKRVLKTIDHMDNKILFQHGLNVIVAVLSRVDLPVIRRKLVQLTNRFEYYYKDELATWKGDVDAFFGANKIINEFFPIEEYIKDKEISSEWIIENLFTLHGLSSIVTLLTVQLGLKEPKKIAEGTGINEKMVKIILRTLQDLLVLDSEYNLTEKGKLVIALYNKKKGRYLNILKLAKEKEDLQ